MANVQAIKTCPSQGQVITQYGPFQISTSQFITWNAEYHPSQWCPGNSLFLSTTPGGAGIPLTNSGETSGIKYVNPNTYVIDITQSTVGQGTYTVAYDHQWSLGLSGPTLKFLPKPTNGNSQKLLFTISFGTVPHALAQLSIALQSNEVGSPVHFVLVNLPGHNAPLPASFEVEFVPGSSVGSFSATISVTGSSSHSPAPTIIPASITVTGETVAQAHGNDIQPNEALGEDQPITSEDANFTYAFVYQQSDANLVLYRQPKAGGGPTPLWWSGTGRPGGNPGGVCILQGDGNLVIYDAGGEVLWDSHTGGPTSKRLVLNGGQVVIEPLAGGSPVWSRPRNDVLPNEALGVDQPITSEDATYMHYLVYQSDGNLVLYRQPKAGGGQMPLWSSGTSRPGGNPGGLCILQGDGNLVIYDAGRQVLWDAHTGGGTQTRLVLQAGGHVVIEPLAGGSPVWSRP